MRIILGDEIHVCGLAAKASADRLRSLLKGDGTPVEIRAAIRETQSHVDALRDLKVQQSKTS